MYHSDQLVTRWFLNANKRTRNKDIRNAVQRGALEEATSEEREVFYKFGLMKLGRAQMALTIVVVFVWFLEAGLDPFGFPFLLLPLMLILVFNVALWTRFDRKRKESEAGELVAFTRTDLQEAVRVGVIFGIIWTAIAYLFGVGMVLDDRAKHPNR